MDMEVDHGSEQLQDDDAAAGASDDGAETVAFPCIRRGYVLESNCQALDQFFTTGYQLSYTPRSCDVWYRVT